MDATLQAISAEEHNRLMALYGPLTDAVRDLIDATIRTEADEDTIRAARTAIAAVTETLRASRLDRPPEVRYVVDGRPLVWGNAAIGLRKPDRPAADNPSRRWPVLERVQPRRGVRRSARSGAWRRLRSGARPHAG